MQMTLTQHWSHALGLTTYPYTRPHTKSITPQLSYRLANYKTKTKETFLLVAAARNLTSRIGSISTPSSTEQRPPTEICRISTSAFCGSQLAPSQHSPKLLLTTFHSSLLQVNNLARPTGGKKKDNPNLCHSPSSTDGPNCLRYSSDLRG